MQVTALGQRIVEIGDVLGRHVVPHEQVAHPPTMEIEELRAGRVPAQHVQELTTLLFRQTQNFDGVTLVHEETLPPGHRMLLHDLVHCHRDLGLLVRRQAIFGCAVRHELGTMVGEAEGGTEIRNAVLGLFRQSFVGRHRAREARIAQSPSILLGDFDGVQQRSTAGSHHVGEIGVPVTPGMGYADVTIFFPDVGDDENFRMLRVSPLAEYVDLQIAEIPAEVDLLLRRQLLIAKQQNGMLFIGRAQDGDAVIVHGPGKVDPAHLGAQNRVERMDGSSHDGSTVANVPLRAQDGASTATVHCCRPATKGVGRGLEVRQLGVALGAEIRGVDLSQPLDATAVNCVRNAFLEHIVLVIRGQSLAPAAQIAFTEHFGAVEPHPLSSRRAFPGFPKLLVLENRPGKPGARNNFWHSDISHAECPPAVSLLHALEVPEGRGDTIFCNVYAAYEQLSPGMQHLLENLQALHSGEATAKRNREAVTDALPIAEVPPPIAHPVVRTHPETGRKALYVNPFFTQRFTDMSESESAPIMNYIYELATRPENLYRHRWANGDVLMWDNRCAMHYAIKDYDEHMLRHMHRTTAAGDRPY